MNREWLQQRMIDKGYVQPLEIDFGMAKLIMPKQEIKRLKQLLKEFNECKYIETEDLRFLAVHVELLHSIQEDPEMSASYKKIKRGALYVMSILILGLLILIGATLTVIFAPELLGIFDYVLIIVSAAVIVFMIYSKETTRKDTWRSLPIVVQIGWWVLLLFNMYNLGDNLFKIIQ